MAYFKPFPRFVFGGANKFRALLNQMASTIEINKEKSPVFAADNMLLIAKICGFLHDDKFVEIANKHFLGDNLHSSIVWRIHILSWAIESCKNLDGDFIEFGCYDAKVANFLIEFNDIKIMNKTFHLYDIFDNPPTAKGEMHSPELYNDVKEMMSKYDFVNVVRGLLPDSFKSQIPDKLAFVHMDLNSAETEIALLNLFFDKLVPGGMLILDDYGTMGYEKQYYKEKEFFANLNYSVLELPTGGGLVIKR
ncbi:MAG: hypothetical protein CMD72_04570 [Gammaproteobacteria bacterium]|nr:hypothetical protein [Gammaproteobacteria bacterium]|tara:strand:- start:636 stop:1385 length:750 start_codon:yes stop_codon:yes gene_type:complete